MPDIADLEQHSLPSRPPMEQSSPMVKVKNNSFGEKCLKKEALAHMIRAVTMASIHRDMLVC